MKINQDELFDLIEAGDHIRSSPWKWGTTEVYHVVKDEIDYLVWFQQHTTEGVQDEEFRLIPAKQITKTITEWVPA